MSERINYTVENGMCIGWGENSPVVAQGDSLEDMKANFKVTFEAWVKNLQKTLASDDFMYVEMKPTTTEQSGDDFPDGMVDWRETQN